MIVKKPKASTKEHYVNNKEFYAAMVEYKAVCKKAEAEGLIQPRIPNYIGMCIYKIANRLAFRPNFINYTYRDEMISDGIETSIANIRSFNSDKYDNPFAYFTQIIYHAFIIRIQKEKKQQYVKYKSLEQAIISNDQYAFQDSDNKNIASSGYNDAAIHVISSFEDTLQKKKNELKKKKLVLENFVEIEEENAN